MTERHLDGGPQGGENWGTTCGFRKWVHEPDNGTNGLYQTLQSLMVSTTRMSYYRFIVGSNSHPYWVAPHCFSARVVERIPPLKHPDEIKLYAFCTDTR